MKKRSACMSRKWPKHSTHPKIPGPWRVSSFTAGREKGPACKASPQDRYFAKRSRAYRDPLVVKTGAYRNWWKNGMRKAPPGSIGVPKD